MKQVTLPKLYYPFPPAINEHADTVHEGIVDWAGRFRLLPGEAAYRLFSVTSIGRLAARTHPDVPLDELQLISDWYGWLFFRDDKADDSEIGRRPGQLSAADGRLLDVLEGDEPTERDEPLAHALCDLRERLRERLRIRGLSDVWMRRFVRAVRGHLEATLWEATNRALAAVPVACEKLSGYTVEELLQKSFVSLIIEEDLERTLRHFEKAARGEPQNYETDIAHKDGHRVELNVTNTPIIVEGEIVGVYGIAKDITERKRAEEALRGSEERYRTILEQIEDGYFEVDLAGNFTFFNDSVCRLLGYSRDDLVGMNNREYMDQESAKKVYQHFNRVYRTGEPLKGFDWELTKKDGGRLFVETSVSLIRDAEGEPVGFRGIIRDITERKRVEENLRQSEERYRAVVERTTDGIFLGDFETNCILESNAALQDMLGYTPDELREMSLYEVIAADPESIDRNSRRILEEKSFLIGERRYRRKDGSLVDVETSATLIPYGGKEVSCCIARDITERKRAEEALRESEERFRQLFEQAVDTLLVHDESGRIFDCNAEACRSLGYTREEMLSLSVSDFATNLASGEEIPNSDALWRHTATSDLDRPVTGVHLAEHQRKDGTTFPVEVRVGFIDYSGKRMMLAAARDITERKKAEYKVRRSESSLAKAQRIAHVGNWEYDVEKNEAYWSDEMYRIFGFAPQEFVPTYKTFSDSIHPDDKGFIRRLARKVLYEGKRYSIDFRIVRPGGDVRVVHTQHEVVYSDTGRPIRLVGTVHDITERKRTEEELRRSEARNKAILEATPDLMFIYSRDGEYLDIQANAPGKLYLPRETLIGSNIRDMLPPEVADPFLRKIARTLGTGEGQTYEYRLSVPEGMLDFEARLVVSGPDEVLCAVRDVTERKRVENALKESEQRFRQLFEHSVEALIVHDEEGKIVDCNEETCRSLGYRREELLAMSVRDIANGLLSEEERREREKRGDTLWQRIAAGELYTPAVVHFGEHKRKDGTTFPIEVRVGGVDYGGKRMILASVRDITERKALEEQLAHRAFHDSLTDLPNRVLFMDRLGHALAQADRRGGKIAVLFVDLDNFKLVNDSLGHEAGDRLLVAVAERLRRCLRPGDTAARLGGDEFTVLLEGVDVHDAIQVAERVAEALRAPFDLEERQIFTSVSIGIVLNATNEDEPGNLLRNADLALYQAKGSGKAGYAVFDPSMSTHALEHLELGNDLRRALQRDEFKVCYQPKVLLETGEILGVEALVRWEHPERGLLLPADFVPIAEETGLILPIGQRVLEEACRQARVWQEQCPGGPPRLMCVNLSARQFQHPDLAEDIARVLRETGLDPCSLCLEITESAVMKDGQSTITTLQELKGLGVKFAIDDFGTGYSSLSYLKRFPVSFLKIDRSFIDGLEKDPEDTVLVSGIITLARTLGMRVIAEGVETAEQLARLREMGCDIAQGNYFSEPVSGRAVTAFLANDLRW